MKNNILLLFTLLCLYSCKPDKPNPVIESDIPDPPCIDLPPSPNDIWGYDYLYPKYGYSSTSFHPQNPDLLLLLRTSYTSVDICTYNLKSKELDVVYSTQEGLGTGWVVWGSDDWIFFPGKDRHIWKIRASGEGLTQVTDRVSNFFPMTNAKKGKLVFTNICFGCTVNSTGQTADKVQLFFYDDKDRLYDSLRVWSVRGYTWEHNEQIAMFSQLDPMGTTGTVEILDPLSKARQSVSTYDFNGDTEMGICWLGEHKLWYSLLKGIYEVDIRTQTTRQLRKTCETFNYGSLSYCPQRRQVVAVRLTQKLVGENLVEYKLYVCLLDTHGKEIEVLEIPEPK